MTAARAVEPAKPKSVTFEVQALPLSAQILLDGRLLGTHHYLGPQASRGGKVTLEVRADGHLSERKELLLDRDMSLQIVLAPDPALASVNQGLAVAGDASASNPPAAPQTVARVMKKPSGKCNPPYVFAADGVKTYKPECF